MNFEHLSGTVLALNGRSGAARTWAPPTGFQCATAYFRAQPER